MCLLAVDIRLEELLECIHMLAAPRKRVADDLRQRLLAVDAPAVDVETRRFERKPCFGIRELLFGPQRLHQIFGVAADRES